VFLKALQDIEDPACWPTKGLFENAFEVPVEYEEPKREPKRRRSDTQPTQKEVKKRRKTFNAEDTPKEPIEQKPKASCKQY
jgi:hypothetical protein